MFDISIVFDYIDPLLKGLWTTAWISGISIFIGLILGVALALTSNGKHPLWSRLVMVYVSFFRGTPLLVQLAIVFYFLPLAGIFVPSIVAAVLVLSMNTAAFQSEILRGGFRTLPKGQEEAAWSYGITQWQCFFYIKLPQVLRKTLPSLVNETIDIIKNSALISTIAVTDLMRIVQSYSSTTYRPLEFFITAGALYLILTCTVSYVGQRIEQKLIQHQGA